jgi:predicted membrane-bound mannosyltransferase
MAKKNKSRRVAAPSSTLKAETSELGYANAHSSTAEIEHEGVRPDDSGVEFEPWTERDPRFWQAALAVLVLGITLRQLMLANFPFHPDEAIHGWFALGFANYNYDPVYHGPLLYHLLAATYGFFGGIFKVLHVDLPGANDYTARLVASLMGIGLLLSILYGPLRRWFGARATLGTLALVVLSPVIVTYSRRLLHDSLVLLLTFWAIMCFQLAREHPAYTAPGRAARIGLAVSLTLFVTTKANAFFIIAMLVAFWVIAWLQRWRDRVVSLPSPRGAFAEVLANVPLMLLIIVSIASHFALRDANLERNEAWLRLVCVGAVTAMGLWLVLVPRDLSEGEPRFEDETPLPQPEAKRRTWQTNLRAAWLSVFLFAFLFGHGWQWYQVPMNMVKSPAAWANQVKLSAGDIASEAAKGPAGFANFVGDVLHPRPQTPEELAAPHGLNDWTKLPMAVAQDWNSVVMAMPQMISYWGGQQKRPRLPGPHDYYLVLMTLYEAPIVIVAIGGILFVSRRRTPFTDLVLWWAFTSFVLYALANEKVPWLLNHIMLPFCLLGGYWLAHLRPQSTLGRNALAVAGVASAIFLLRNISGTNFERAVENREPMFYAQTTEDFVETLQSALRQTAGSQGAIWVHGEKQWPPAWYLREGAPYRGTSGVGYGSIPGPEDHRFLVTTEEDWALKQNEPRWKDWKGKVVFHYIWPRASWPALRTDRFWRWWFTREALSPTEQPKPMSEWKNSIFVPPGEWSHNTTVIATKAGL